MSTLLEKAHEIQKNRRGRGRRLNPDLPLEERADVVLAWQAGTIATVVAGIALGAPISGNGCNRYVADNIAVLIRNGKLKLVRVEEDAK